jgi:hypothetical protein
MYTYAHIHTYTHIFTHEGISQLSPRVPTSQDSAVVQWGKGAGGKKEKDEEEEEEEEEPFWKV